MEDNAPADTATVGCSSLDSNQVRVYIVSEECHSFNLVESIWKELCQQYQTEIVIW